LERSVSVYRRQVDLPTGLEGVPAPAGAHVIGRFRTEPAPIATSGHSGRDVRRPFDASPGSEIATIQVSMGKRVSLFVTCIVDQLFPKVGIAMADVLERAGWKVDFPEAQTCCGQPAFNSGYRQEARTVARHFLDVFRDASTSWSLPAPAPR
jgi:Fe-S oxidoreductase